MIYFEFARINDEFVNDVSKFDIVLVDDLTIFDFENFEFIVYSIKNIEIFRFVYFFDNIVNFLDNDFICNIVIKNFFNAKTKNNTSIIVFLYLYFVYCVRVNRKIINNIFSKIASFENIVSFTLSN